MKPTRVAAALAAGACSFAVTPVTAAHDSEPSWSHDDKLPLVIGHRGAPGYLPDHTLRGYKRAIAMGADFIEPDLVSTKDGVLVARHEPNIKDTTDVAAHPEFADRRRDAVIDGAVVKDDWFVSDFTLKEIKTLRAVQPLAERPKEFNGKFKIPTLKQVLALARSEGRKRGRAVGVYPETKHSTYHRLLGLPLERKLVRALRRAGLNRRHAPVYIQSFEQSNLRRLNRMTPVKLVQLVDAWDVALDGSLTYEAPSLRPYDWTVSGDPALTSRTYGFLTTNAGLDEVAAYADGIGPWKPYIVSRTATDADGNGKADDTNGDGVVDERDWELALPTSLVRRAHRRGLEVHPYTFRDEARRLASDYEGDPAAEYRLFFALGVDGVFSDFPDTAVAARQGFFGG